MSLDARKRQRKAERRKKKEKAKRKELSSRQAEGWQSRLARAAHSPVMHCLISGNQGMHHVLLSRQLANGMVAFADFLVDAWCLGVKDVFFDIAPPGHYEDKIHSRLRHQEGARTLSPESARKFVEGAVEYARGLGLSPHPDYDKGRAMFGNLNAADSRDEFSYGHDGKPYFVSGPFDPAWRCKAIVDTLLRTCGEGRFDYVIHLSADQFDKPALVSEGDWETVAEDEFYDEVEDDDEGDEFDDVVDEASPPRLEQ